MSISRVEVGTPKIAIFEILEWETGKNDFQISAPLIYKNLLK